LFFIFSIIIFIRSSYPRFRYDFLIRIFWFKVLPVILIILWFFFCLLFL
jgi:NADH:ubiquinone oxidoreductase subunit H